MCSNESSAAAALLPYGLKPLSEGTAAYALHPAITPAALEHYRLQLYNYAYVDRFRYAATHPAAAALASPYAAITASYMPHAQDGGAAAAAFALSAYAKLDPRACYRMQEEPKPQHSYIGLIGMAILSSPEKKLVLSDIYQYILDNYSYFRTRGPGWRNSIRHNLSLNDCFIKAGRSANGKGHYWAIHPANLEDFKKGDFRRRKAQRRVRKHMGLSVPEDEESPSPPPPPPPNATSMAAVTGPRSDPPLPSVTSTTTTAMLPRKRLFDVESLLAPDPCQENLIKSPLRNNIQSERLCDNDCHVDEDDEPQSCSKDSSPPPSSCSPTATTISPTQEDILNEAGRKYSPDTTADVRPLPCWPLALGTPVAWQPCPRKLAPGENPLLPRHQGSSVITASPHDSRWHETVSQFLRSSQNHHQQQQCFKLLKLGDV